MLVKHSVSWWQDATLSNDAQQYRLFAGCVTSQHDAGGRNSSVGSALDPLSCLMQRRGSLSSSKSLVEGTFPWSYCKVPFKRPPPLGHKFLRKVGGGRLLGIPPFVQSIIQPLKVQVNTKRLEFKQKSYLFQF